MKILEFNKIESSPGIKLIKEFEKEIRLNTLHGLDDEVVQKKALEQYVKYLEDHYKRTT